MGSLPNLDIELFYFIAATKLPLIRSERKKNVSVWSVHSISAREAYDQSFRVFKFLFRETAFLSQVGNVPGVRFTSLFLSLFCSYVPWVASVIWAQSWE